MREKVKVKCTIQDLVRPAPVSYIVPKLFLGDKHAASDQAELQRLNITHIVNCAKGLADAFATAPPDAPSRSSSSTTTSTSCTSAGSSSDEEMNEVDDDADLRCEGEDEGPREEGSWSPIYHRCELLDSSRHEADFEHALEAAFAFIDLALTAQASGGQGGAVLIHCCAGRSRGPALMTAYLIHRYRWSLAKAYAFVCQARPVVCPNRGFLSALLKLEKRLLGANSMRLRHNALVPLQPGR